ncbi:MAG: DUF4097 family beta strand repeat-containing protein [Gemmatimonadota bacterium]
MPLSRLIIPLTAALASLIGASRLVAQSPDDRWVRDCERSGSDAREQYCEIRHAGFKPTGSSLTIDPGANGGVEVQGWDRDSVAITLRIQSGAAAVDEARRMAAEVSVLASGTRVKVEGPSSGRHQTWSVDIVVMVPRTSGLSIATTNGSIDVRSVVSLMDLRTVNGSIGLADVGGDVRARCTNGALSVSLTGVGWEGKRLDAETVNGSVTLALPDSYNAELETGTVNGETNLQVPLQVTTRGRSWASDRFRTTLGTGGAHLRVVTTNGSTTIGRAHDDAR